MIRIVILLAVICGIGILGSVHATRADDAVPATSIWVEWNDVEFWGTVSEASTLVTCQVNVGCADVESFTISTDISGRIAGPPSAGHVQISSGDFGCQYAHVDPSIQIGDHVHVHVQDVSPSNGWSSLSACYAGDAISKCTTNEPNQLNTCSLKTGDLVLIHKDDLLYKALHTLFGGYWTHVGIYDGRGRIIESYPYSPGNNEPGVQITPIDSPLRDDFRTAPDWAIVRVQTDSDAEKDFAVQVAANKAPETTTYNWNYPNLPFLGLDASSGKTAFYCSEFVWWSYAQAGVDLNKAPFLGLKHTPIPPDELYADPNVHVVLQRSDLKRTVLALNGTTSAAGETKIHPFAVGSTADLYVTDNIGRHAGVDPTSHQIVDEIPGVLYTGPDSELQVMSIENMGDTWHVDVVGNYSGQYTLQAEPVEPGDPHIASLTTGTAPGHVDDYSLHYPNSPGQPLTISPTSTPTGQLIWGNSDCSADGITSRDSQAVLKNVLAKTPLSQEQGCPTVGAPVTVAGVALTWGNWDCSADGITSRDSQAVLKNVLQKTPLSEEPGCPAVGDSVTVS